MNPGYLFRALAATACTRSDQPAFTFLDSDFCATMYSYDELFASVDHLAGSMEERGLGALHGPLGILLSAQEDQTLHYLAALRIGAVPAILTPPNPKLNPEYYSRTMTTILRQTQFAALITDLADIDAPAPVFLPYSIEPKDGKTKQVLAATTSLPREASFLQFSSGTTGIKRGVLVTDQAVVSQLETYSEALDIGINDRIISWLPLYHDMGFIACLNMPLYRGIHTIVIDPIDWVTKPSLFLIAASHFEGTLSWNPNFAYAFMAQRIRDDHVEGLDLSSLRGLVNCSEPVTYASQEQFLKRYQPLGLRDDVFMGCYAMAETTFALTHGDSSSPGYLDSLGPSHVARGSDTAPHISVGHPLAGVEMIAVDDYGNHLPDREVGEIWVRSPFNFSRYYAEEQATKSAFRDGWYRTGDLGYRVGDAWYVTGRSKDVLVVGGVNVFPGDIEQIVSDVAGILPGRAVAFSRFDPQAQTERLTVLAESDLEGPRAREAIVEVRQQILACFQIANFEVHLVTPGWLVKSTSGKIARPENRDKWQRSTRASPVDR